jgi:hypothetical protein
MKTKKIIVVRPAQELKKIAQTMACCRTGTPAPIGAEV